MPAHEVSFSREDIISGDVGSLYLFTRWRAKRVLVPKDAPRPWHETEHSLPLSEVAVVPRSVLLWDHESDRPNSMKRFAYMLGLRATPLALVGGDSPGSLRSLIEVTAQADQIGYQESRGEVQTLLAGQLATHVEVGHVRRENTRLRFCYEPPQDKESLQSIHAFLSENMGEPI